VAAPAVFTVRRAVMISLPGPVADGVSTSNVQFWRRILQASNSSHWFSPLRPWALAHPPLCVSEQALTPEITDGPDQIARPPLRVLSDTHTRTLVIEQTDTSLG
jgi:hypothetical protein